MSKTKTGFYIDFLGHVHKIGYSSKPLNTEKYGFVNWFYTRSTANVIRDILEDNWPRIYYVRKETNSKTKSR